jgi:mRNA interferase MazF
VKKGDIVLIPFPFTDLTGYKLRPALVLALRKSDVVVAFITSKIGLMGQDDVMVIPDAHNGLKQKSLIMVGKVATLDSGVVEGRLGHLNEGALQRVDRKLMQVFDLRVA